MVTMTKFTTTDTNIPVLCFNLMEIALHSDLSATPSHVRRSNSLPFRCSCAWPAVEMGIEPPASAARPLNDAQSHLRGMKQAFFAHASAHAEQLRGRSRLPGSGRAPTSRTPLFGSHAGRFDRSLSRNRTRSRSRAMLSQGLVLASTMMECTVRARPARFDRFLDTTDHRPRGR